MPDAKKKAVVVTGSSGLIGVAVCNRLARRFNVVGFDRAGPPHPPRTAECVLLRIAGVYDDGGHSIPIAHQMQRINERMITGHVCPGDTSRGQAFIHLEDLIDAVERVVDRQTQVSSRARRDRIAIRRPLRPDDLIRPDHPRLRLESVRGRTPSAGTREKQRRD